MKVDNQLIDHLAHLARLEFDDTSKAEMRSDLTKILDFVAELDKVDTEGVDPLVYISEEKNVLRADEVNHPISQAEALKNAPQKDTDYIKVPKVLK